MLKLLDLFSGIGGFSYAAHMTGEIETIAFCEIEPYARKVLAKNYPLVDNYTDVTTLCLEEKDTNEFISKHGRPDIICGGAPCQPWSIARAVDDRPKGEDDPRDLWSHYLRIVRVLRPSWIIQENVKNFTSVALDRNISDLEREGYTSEAFILPACSVSAPHLRERCWVVSHSQSQRLQGQFQSSRASQGWEESIRSAATSLVSSSKTARINQWGREPNVRGVCNGVPARMERLKCLGNAIVPQVAYVLFKLIVETDKLTKGDY